MARTPEEERLVNDLPRRIPAWGLFRVHRLVSFLFVATIVVTFLVMMGESKTPQYINYTTITGFFQQDDPATVPGTFDYTTHNFGLIDRAYDTDGEYDPDLKKTQWQRFDHQLFRLNRESGRKVQYKLLFLGRHGEGYHNVAESYYGTPAWDCYWSLQDGNETVSWADARITANGVTQAQKAHDFWATQIKDQKIPTPESYYSSPLTRCMETARITFSGLDLPSRHPFVPTIKELFREGIGAHTCDRRSTKTEIHQNFPTYLFEEGFKEEDPLWEPLLRESNSAQDARSKIVLDDVFSSDDATYLSVSSHSGEIASLLRVLGHRTFSLSTGQVIPVLVKAETVTGTAPTTTIAPYTTVSTCATPPPTPTPA